jgi:hypothetical protein
VSFLKPDTGGVDAALVNLSSCCNLRSGGSRALALALAWAAWLLTAPSAHAAFEATGFEAGTCFKSTCTYKLVEKELEESGHSSEAFTQSAGHPPWGVTTFGIKEKEGGAPEGKLKRLRVDVPLGLAANPQALPKCSQAAFKEEVSKCGAESEVGTVELTVHVGAVSTPFSGKIYNLEPPRGLPLEFGIFVEIEIAKGNIVHEHLLLEGHVSWAKERKLEERGIASGDYHEWFEIREISKETSELAPVVKSKLNFNGRAGTGNFITLPTACSSSTTAYLEVQSWEGQKSFSQTSTPVGVEGCGGDPFAPSALLSPETALSDLPDGVTTMVKVPQYEGGEQVNTADVRAIEITLPEGLTLNPAAAKGLETCSPAQIAIGSAIAVACPGGSKLGTVTIETDLPPGSLSGNVYLGNPAGGAITGPPFTIYLDAESERYGVSVRQSGLVYADPGTGRLTARFTEAPQLPFSELAIKTAGGPQAPLANPLQCGAGYAQARFASFTTPASMALSNASFATGGCLSPLPFSLTQSAQHGSVGAGAFTSYTFGLARGDGQQYLAQVSTLLPAGLSGLVSGVTLCGEPQAQQGSCSPDSQIGTATALLGSGPEPFPVTGPVFLTGPYNGAPFGLSIPIAAVAGPFNLGTTVTRAAIGIDPHTARVSATGTLPTIVGGVPLRLKGLSVSINRSGFLVNPTNCGLLATETALTSTLGATQLVSTPFQVSNCEQLAFGPSLEVATNGHLSKADGASLEVNFAETPHQANVRAITVELPKQLPARLSTLQKACPAPTFAADPSSCPAGARIGSASAVTPVLPAPIVGPAYLVSHGGAAFPDLVVLLEGSGVHVILTGTTAIKNGTTTASFSALPDVPVSSFTLTLPAGHHSLLTANGPLCNEAFEVLSTITSQNGAQVKQGSLVAVGGCGGRTKLFRIIKRRVVGHMLLVKIRTFVAGTLVARGSYLKRASRKLSKAFTVWLRLPLTSRGVNSLTARRRVKTRVRVSLAPSRRGEAPAAAYTKIVFKR